MDFKHLSVSKLSSISALTDKLSKTATLHKYKAYTILAIVRDSKFEFKSLIHFYA